MTAISRRRRCRGSARDLVVVEPEHLAEHLERVLAEARRREARARCRSRRSGTGGPRTGTSPISGCSRRPEERRWASCGSSMWSLERCTIPAGTPAACSSSISSRGSCWAVNAPSSRSISSRCGLAPGAACRAPGPSPTPARRATPRSAAPLLVGLDGDRAPLVVAGARVGVVRRAVRVVVAVAPRASTPDTCTSSSSGARKCSDDSICAWSMYCPSPVRRRWSSAASSTVARKRGAIVSV